jgi:hypothetical protein
LATQAMKHAAPLPSSPTAAAAAILKAALSNAEGKTVSKTSLATPFAPLKVSRPRSLRKHFQTTFDCRCRIQLVLIRTPSLLLSQTLQSNAPLFCLPALSGRAGVTHSRQV